MREKLLSVMRMLIRSNGYGREVIFFVVPLCFSNLCFLEYELSHMMLSGQATTKCSLRAEMDSNMPAATDHQTSVGRRRTSESTNLSLTRKLSLKRDLSSSQFRANISS